ncbi:high-affinity branched-chain amino acid ABC transporter permease LivM [Methyloceanibacter sp.]|uniref:high-affinity branched-chain amino acid ABC transporter permease LivM n=1 Tax=Methyloceanibacter sp. TaxID=1965321 RepID=UPI002D1FAA7D|nr:high-affinity branched-chain amino acid ABC transporter permease LivM [Methyloceanibacter sp.]
MRLADSGKTLGRKLSSALGDSLLAATIAFALFSLVLGLRTVDSATGLALEPRPALLATVVAIVFFGRLALNLFVWQTDYPLTRPFAKLFTLEPFETRDEVTLALAFALGVLGVAAGVLFQETLYGLLGTLMLAFIGIGLLRRAIVRTFPNLPYTQVFVAGGILFALFFPIVSYALESAFNLGLPLRYWFDLSILILTYVMLGWGLNIVVGLAGLLDLGYVAFYAVGAYTFALLATHFGLGFWIGLPIAGAAAALWGIILGFPVLRLRGDYLAIVTLAFGEIVRIILLNWTEVTGGPNGIAGIPKPTFFGLPFSPFAEGTTFSGFFGIHYDGLHALIFLYYVILVLALVTNLVTLRLRRLPVGRAWEAMREDEIACRSLGINTTLTKLSAFATGAMFGGLAGCFFATRQGFVSPESFTFIESAIILAIVVLGGMGSQLGVAIAAIVMVGGFEALRHTAGLQAIFGQEFDPALYRMLLFGLAMVAIMIWRPRGLVSSRAPTISLGDASAISGDLVRQGRG